MSDRTLRSARVSTPKSVIRIWLPAVFCAEACLFLSGMSPDYWLLAVPLVPIVVFMLTLAEVHEEGRQVHIERLWGSAQISKEDVLQMGESFLDGIGMIRPKRFVFPFGRIYFVHEWSTKKAEGENSSKWNLLASAAMAISGFFAARVVNIHGLAFSAPHARILGLVLAGGLCTLFAATRRRKPAFANCVLFAAAYIVGLVRV